MMKPISWFYLALPSTYFGLPALAQSNDTSPDNQCSRYINDINEGDTTFNSTGTTHFNFPGQDEWHLSITFDFHLARNTSVVRDVSSRGDRVVFLSLPESFVGSARGNATEMCFYRMNGVNETSDAGDDGNASCDGILSEECQEALGNAPLPSDGSCPRVDIQEECGRPMSLWTSVPFNFSNPECTSSGLPGIDLPDGYLTQYVSYEGIILPAEEEAFYESYDLLVRQPLPILLTARFPGQDASGAAEFRCLVPDDLAEGSRVPEGSFPPDAAGSIDARSALVSAVAVSCALILMLSL